MTIPRKMLCGFYAVIAVAALIATWVQNAAYFPKGAGFLNLDPPMGCWCGVECDCAALNRVGAGGGRAWSPDLCIGLFLFVFRVEGRWGLAG